MRLAGKSAVVTGGGGGFGEGIAKAFAAEGAKIVVADINHAAAERVAAEVGGTPVTGDVTSWDDVRTMVEVAVMAFGGLDIVVNNAGTTHRNQPLLDVDEATFDRLYAVNVKSIYWMTHAAVPVLRRQGRGGSIINISSPRASGLAPG